jgi:hypothetical protein
VLALFEFRAQNGLQLLRKTPTSFTESLSGLIEWFTFFNNDNGFELNRSGTI